MLTCMLELFEYVQHPHVHQRKETGPPQIAEAVAADARSLATYNDASAVLEEAKQIQVHLKAQDDAIQQILATLHTPKPS